MLERQLAARELGGGMFAPLQNEKLSHGLTRGRRLKGKGKGVLGARETRGAREEGEKETAFLSLPPCSPRPCVSLAPKTSFPFLFKRLPRRLVNARSTRLCAPSLSGLVLSKRNPLRLTDGDIHTQAELVLGKVPLRSMSTSRSWSPALFLLS